MEFSEGLLIFSAVLCALQIFNHSFQYLHKIANTIITVEENETQVKCPPKIAMRVWGSLGWNIVSNLSSNLKFFTSKPFVVTKRI